MTSQYADPDNLLKAPWKRFDRLPSTNQYLLDLPANELLEGTTCTALIQTNGIGRNNRVWHSPLGGLYLSIAVKPDTPPSQWSQLSLVMACAGSIAIKANFPDTNPLIKWPNDILIENRKVAGVLLQSSNEKPCRVVAGIGINVSLNPVYLPKRPVFPATVLSFESQYPTNLRELEIAVRRSFIELYCLWQRKPQEVVQKWQALCGLSGHEIVFQAPNGTVNGKYSGINDQGFLLIKVDDEILTFPSGDIVGIKE